MSVRTPINFSQPCSADCQSAVSQNAILRTARAFWTRSDFTTLCRLPVGDTADRKSALRRSCNVPTFLFIITALVVSSVKGAEPEDIRDIKPPIDIPNPWAYLWIALGVIAFAAVVVAIWFFFLRKRALPPPLVYVPPHVRAKQRLAEALLFINDSNRFCTAVSDTARLYLEEQFNLRAPERTTEEFLNELKGSSHLTTEQKASLGEFLQSCDLVKFARFEPNETSLRQLHDAALRLVDETQFSETATPARVPAPALAGPAKQVAVPARLPDAAQPGEPVTLKYRLAGLGLAALFILPGIAMWIWPDLGLVPDEANPSGRGGRRLAGFLKILEWLWSRPVGGILLIVGALLIYDAVMRRRKPVES